jgi:hypothetical protein
VLGELLPEPIMNRRHVLAALGALAAGAVVDPDFLTWEPGAKAYFDMVGSRRIGMTLTVRLPQRYRVVGVAGGPVEGWPGPSLDVSWAVQELRARIDAEAFAYATRVSVC